MTVRSGSPTRRTASRRATRDTRAEQELDGCHVYRIDPDGALTVVADDFVRPNGLAFSRDETQLYVVDTPARTFAGST